MASFQRKFGVQIKHRTLVSVFLAFGLVISTPPVYAQSPDGTLDSSFGTSGSTTTTTGSNDSIRSIALDSQGRIIAGGYSRSGGVDKFTLARYSSNGVLDTSFGTSGFTTTTFGPTDPSGTVASITLDSQGRIIAGGSALIGGVNKFVLARYTTNGALDTSFGTSGFTTTSPGSNDTVRSIALDAQGRIIAGGSSLIGGVNKFVLARYTTNGALDTSFGTSGFTTTTPGTNDTIVSITLDSQERIIAGGQSWIGSNKFALTRYTANGALDTSFGTSGFTTTTPGTDDGIYSITLDSQERIIASGGAQVGGNYTFALARYTTNGTLDTSFGTSGFNTSTKGSSDGSSSVALDVKGRIIVAGVAKIDTVNKFALARYTADGALDTSFGTSGFTTTTIGSNAGIIAIIRDSQGRIIAGGYALDGSKKFALSRYLILRVPIFTLSTTSETASAGSAVTGYVITSSGGAIDSYSISPAVSNGLSFDASTGLISGTPITTASNVIFTITGINSSGTTSATYSLTVNPNPAVAQAAAEAARVAAANSAAEAAKKQKELMGLLSVIPSIAGLSVNIGDLANSLLIEQKCTKGKRVKYVKNGASCPRGYAKKK